MDGYHHTRFQFGPKQRFGIFDLDLVRRMLMPPDMTAKGLQPFCIQELGPC